MDIKLIFGFGSSLIILLSFIPYIRDILNKKTEPHTYSWLIWGILQVIAAVAQVKNGAGYGSWSSIIISIICFLIVLLSLKNGLKNITKFDSFCLILSLVVIVVYIMIKNPVWAILMAIGINLMGLLPTLIKVYKKPQSETPETFAMGVIATFLSLLALQNYTLVTTLYLTYTMFANLFLTIVIVWRKEKIKCKAGL